MAEQLTGVLREVLAAGDGTPRPAFSALFSPDLQAVGAEAGELDGSGWATAVAAVPPSAQIVAGLPVPQVDITDPAAGYLATLGTLDPGQLTATLSAAVGGEAGTPSAVAESAETRLALARALIVTGALGGAASTLAELAARPDWRVTWYQGLRGWPPASPAAARAAFDAVYDALPGELAPQLALGFAAEAAGDAATAARYFGRVWMVDRSYVSAAFGLARAKLAADDRPGAIAALAEVPPTSSHYVAAQIAAVRIHLAAHRPVPGRVRRSAGGGRPAGPADAGRRPAAAPHRRDPAGRARCRGRGSDGGRRAACSAASQPSTRSAPGWSRATGRWPGSRPTRRGGSSWWTGPTRSARGPGCNGRRGGPEGWARRAGVRGVLRLRRAGRGGGQLLRVLRGGAGPAHGQRRPGSAAPGVCEFCHASRISADGYCESCGRKVPSGRDHQETDLGTVAGVTDRGLRHHRNEDAMALGTAATPAGPAAVAVVCDGVSTSADPDEASLAAVRAAAGVLLTAARTGADLLEASPAAVRAAAEAVAALAGPPGRRARSHLRLRGDDRRGHDRVLAG